MTGRGSGHCDKRIKAFLWMIQRMVSVAPQSGGGGGGGGGDGGGGGGEGKKVSIINSVVM